MWKHGQHGEGEDAGHRTEALVHFVAPHESPATDWIAGAVPLERH
jgi:hypothetical protein